MPSINSSINLFARGGAAVLGGLQHISTELTVASITTGVLAVALARLNDDYEREGRWRDLAFHSCVPGLFFGLLTGAIRFFPSIDDQEEPIVQIVQAEPEWEIRMRQHFFKTFPERKQPPFKREA